MGFETVVDRGADKTWHFDWKDAESVAIPLSEVMVLCRYPALQFSVIETDLANGIFEVKLEGTAPLNKGAYPFRVQGTMTNGDTIASPEVTINVR